MVVLTIYEAKTHLSKLVKQVKAGEEVVIGGFGKPEVMLVPYKAKQGIKLGLWSDKPKKHDSEALVSSDPEVNQLFDDALNDVL